MTKTALRQTGNQFRIPLSFFQLWISIILLQNVFVVGLTCQVHRFFLETIVIGIFKRLACWNERRDSCSDCFELNNLSHFIPDLIPPETTFCHNYKSCWTRGIGPFCAIIATSSVRKYFVNLINANPVQQFVNWLSPGQASAITFFLEHLACSR